MILLFASCTKQHPQKIWLFDEDEVTKLNGKVKQVSISNNQDLYKAYFDEKGNIEYSEKRILSTWRDYEGKHSTIDTYKVKYLYFYNDKGIKTAITGTRLDKGHNVSKWELDAKENVTFYWSNTADSSYCASPYKYNNKNELIEYKRIYCFAVVPDLLKYKNDSHHLIIESDLYNEKFLLVKTKFLYLTFDEHDNWIKRIEHIQHFSPMAPNDTTHTITRKITYY